jgi:hypothetical protein
VRRRVDRRSRRDHEALWRPEYDALARFNGERARGIMHDAQYAARMAEVQCDYDENYLPASRAMDDVARWTA